MPNGAMLQRQLMPSRGSGLCVGVKRDAAVILNVKFYFKVLLVRKLPLPHCQVHVNYVTRTWPTSAFCSPGRSHWFGDGT